MKKSKAIRLAGFVVALCASGTLIGTSISGTGAYFTDSKDGSVNSTTGDVKVNTSDLSLNFNSLLPGEFKTQTVGYTATGTEAEDIWFVLPADTALNGGPNTALGRYGHFAVDSPSGSFTSYNLRTAPNGVTDVCGVDGNGHGGSNQQASSTDNNDPNSYVSYCPVPNAILLSSNLTNGQSGNATFTFGYTKLLKHLSEEDQTHHGLAAYKIVATQHGIAPNDINNTGNSN